ncbi:MAG: Chromosome partition protein Smc [Planctomycetota bacterium]|jgi:chromosome segregation protein
MLKALELAGFKSFADKTRFEFPAGITVVVGPNGSGKSNVVDAIKWVLGEQSAKSLRGQDMADVIFKGSGTGGRKPANAAEATIVFDNSDRRLPIDAPEVHVTRRVYRGGEGEYLINRQPCRLRDIKDLFRGTGVGVDAYSLIEQGKVDRLLQASPKDRRAMFEEAAGISRFKAKKVEAQRRLERVEQNLLRLQDIVEEVDNRLRGVRAQAAKAKRYREYNERLQELRTQVGMSDWHKLSDQLAELDQLIERIRDQAGQWNARVEGIEARRLETESQLAAAATASRETESRMGRIRERTAALESVRDQQRARGRDLRDESARLQERMLSLCRQSSELQRRRRDALNQMRQAEADCAEQARCVRANEARLAEINCELEEHRVALEAVRGEQVALLRQAAALSNEASGYRSQLAVLAETAQRCRQRLEELDAMIAEQTEELARAEASERELETAANECLRKLETAQREVAENRRIQARRQQEIAEMSGVLAGVRERISMLEDWESRREGVGSGVKEVLMLARQSPRGAFAEVRGLVADFIQAGVELAPLVDVALGDVAQYVLVDGDKLIEQVSLGAYRPSARVGFVRLVKQTAASPPPPDSRFELQRGVIGRADRLVEVAPEMTAIVHALLRETWFVEDLATALSLQDMTGTGRRYVTRAGQILEPDGTVVAGPRQTSGALVSRRSELRDLRQRAAVLETQIVNGQREVARLQENIEVQDGRARGLAEKHQVLSARLTDQLVRTRGLAEQRQQRRELRTATDSEALAAERQHDAVAGQLENASGRLASLEVVLAERDSRIRDAEAVLQERDQARQRISREVGASQVELARIEQRREAIDTQLRQVDQDEQQRRRAVADARQQLEAMNDRGVHAERQILRATSELSELALRYEQDGRECRGWETQRDTLAGQRTSIAEEAQESRRQLRSLADELHQRELARHALSLERQTLLARLREDYGIEIEAAGLLSDNADVEAQTQRAAIEEEIAELRKKIQTIGAVNLESIAELDDLERRFGGLSNQYHDLKQAKEALERIIVKINGDSRRLFLETLEKIRGNFQTLYRRAFGGGRADIVLEEGADVLEGGVDIVATPPGKPQFSNSLLSGGEKALTAVALLLAIFQFRPSPFCVLDEVDAPFDEANIGRFIDVLKDFLSFTKFVIVTHSKKTMTSANTLYGVTMQESGVSKRVSVRFEDVSEDGEIRREAIEREPGSSQSGGPSFGGPNSGGSNAGGPATGGHRAA